MLRPDLQRAGVRAPLSPSTRATVAAPCPPSLQIQGSPPDVSSGAALSAWLCKIHNEVRWPCKVRDEVDHQQHTQRDPTATAEGGHCKRWFEGAVVYCVHGSKHATCGFRRAVALALCLHQYAFAQVNEMLGKPAFDCSRVMERWRDGPADGSCG
jgi:hypothetical protein